MHLEFERQYKSDKGFVPFDLEHTDADVIILAGDIGVGFKEESKFCEKIAKEHNKPVVFVLGNHSFYGQGNIDRIRGKWAKYESEKVHYIDEGSHWTYKGVNFVGGIFWTDFNNYDTRDMTVAMQMMNDYNGCRMTKMDSNLDNMHSWNKDGSESNEYYFTPRRSVDEHYKTKEYMNHMLGEWKGQKNVVVTHHLPSSKSSDIRYRGNSLTPAYFSNLDEWVMDRDISLWVHGHAHGSNDYMLGDTRVVCNPRGYFKYEENANFNKSLVIEIS